MNFPGRDGLRVVLAVIVVAGLSWFGLFVLGFLAVFGVIPDSPAYGVGADAAFAVVIFGTMGFFVVADPRSIRTLLGVSLFGIAGLLLLAPETIVAWGFDQSLMASQLAMVLGGVLVLSRRSAVQSSIAESST
ncbi:MAG: hypothetical protein ABEJ86_04930 [Halococcoides sp.]